MPVTGAWEPTTIVQAPRRFRSASVETQAQQQQEQPHKASHTIGLPPVRPRKQNTSSDQAGGGSCNESPSNQTAEASVRPSSDLAKDVNASHAQHSCGIIKPSRALTEPQRGIVAPTTGKAPKSVSIMELVNQAAQKEEREEAILAQRRVALLLAGKSTTKLHAASPVVSNSSSRGGMCTSPRIPRSPMSVRAARPLNPFQTESPRAAAVSSTSLKAAEMALPAASRSSIDRDVPLQPQYAFKHRQLQQQLVLGQAVSVGSDCSSDDIAVAQASMSSSASSSSLCSAASLISNLSTSSSSSSLGRPKSILLTRTSTGSSCSSGSSPRFSKRVTWKDGQASEDSVGRELVAVVMLEDSPEIRQLRKDTWPERPGARRDAIEAKEAAAAAAVQQQKQQAQTGLMGKLLQEPTKLLDWRDKLKQLQTERRQQRMAQVQAAWERQERKMAKQDHSSARQLEQQQQQLAEQQEADATAAVELTGAKAEPVAAPAVSCGTTAGISLVAAASEIQAAG